MRLSIAASQVVRTQLKGSKISERHFGTSRSNNFSAQMTRVAWSKRLMHFSFHTNVLLLVEQWRGVQEITNTTVHNPGWLRARQYSDGSILLPNGNSGSGMTGASVGCKEGNYCETCKERSGGVDGGYGKARGGGGRRGAWV
ncbi:hypothetical protein HBI80_081850 [Parastagonospora nodorum]|nr:hypothetical protein HBI10_126830 [Parastagonospora nodorum]KAH4024080.1 hypothetical protein HBI13_082720 [Parastagonospora nodorum]KAH4906482.1 hypothetical protein HBI80_081850 [Parastagonospora nodorum]